MLTDLCKGVVFVFFCATAETGAEKEIHSSHTGNQPAVALKHASWLKTPPHCTLCVTHIFVLVFIAPAWSLCVCCVGCYGC